ncbi:MAG: secondary thiamine-phosphate synthase enzyme YjbQ [Bacillota bacterium]
MVFEFHLKTERQNCYNITSKVQEAVVKSSVKNGICLVFCPHTTAGITINENADDNVVRDLLIGLEKAFPDREEFRHAEGNSAAHLKSSCIGASQAVIIYDNKLLLGTWQAIYFCEFDGPRNRSFYVRIM